MTDDDMKNNDDSQSSADADSVSDSAGEQAEASANAPMQLLFSDERVEDLAIEDEMRESYLTYAMSTIMDRALPDIRDGLKPSQRRVLVAMNDLNLGPRSKHRKCAKIAGDTSGNYHPHGEGVVYPTLVRMGQLWSMRHPLVHPQGNFGSIDGDPPAAMRYTEARMAAPAVELMEDLKLDTVDFQANYDDTRTEPTVLPGKFPNLLVNGSQGIAVGMATSLPPHNLREICDALVHMIDHPDAELSDVMEFVKGPDFPTGGLICGRSGMIAGYKTGRGKVTVRARMHTEQSRGGKSQIIVTEIPYQVLKTTIIERIAGTVKNGKIAEISDVQDHSDRTGMRIVIDLKKSAEPSVVINQLYKYTPLQATFSIINIALVKRQPRTLGLVEMLSLFIEHRKDVIGRRTRFLLLRARQRAHILEGLILAVADIDKIIEIIKKSPDVPTAKKRLMAHKLRLNETMTVRKLLPQEFASRASAKDQLLTGVQADAILSMQLSRLTGLEIEKLAHNYTNLHVEIEGYEAILANENLLLDIVREDIYEMREKYGDDRRTEIVGAAEDLEIEDLIAEEDVVVTFTHKGYIKRMPVTTYRKQGRGGKGIIGSEAKDDDFVEQLFIASTHDYLLVFLNSGRMNWVKVYDLPSMARQSRGRAIVNLLQIKANEKICAVVPVREFDEDKFLIITTRKGQVKKTALKAYGNVRQGGIIATGLGDGDEVVGVAITRGDDEIVLATANGQAIRFKESGARPMGRTAAGVRGIRLKKDDRVVGMALVDPTATLLTVCENGHGKRTNFDEYRIQGRGGSGIINIKTSERNGKVVGMKSVRDTDELMMITQAGKIIRTGVDEMRIIGRATQGVKVIGLKGKDKLVSVARVVSEDDENTEDQDGQPKLPLDEKNDNPAQNESSEKQSEQQSEKQSENQPETQSGNQPEEINENKNPVDENTKEPDADDDVTML